MSKQKLSPAAAKRKKERDLRYANTRDREIKRADSQKNRRDAKKAGKNIDGKDYDHYTGAFVTAHRNRGGMNPRKNGTKNE
jgi:hypothetical protein